MRFFLTFMLFSLCSQVAGSHGHGGDGNELDLGRLARIRILYNTLARPIIEKKCFDCHSSQTKYPAYYKLPLVKWLIDSDISEAKEHLDFEKPFPFGSTD